MRRQRVGLIPPTPRPWPLAPSVIALLHSTTVAKALPNAFRAGNLNLHKLLHGYLLPYSVHHND